LPKKILFVIPDLGGNGASKSLINLLTIMDKKKYEIDLLVFNRRGLFAELVPEQVNIIEAPSPLKEYWYQIYIATKELLKSKSFNLVYKRVKWKAMEMVKFKPAVVSQKNYLGIKSLLPTLNGSYHAAISYLDFAPTYYVIDKVDADIKIGWNHNDYSKLSPNIEIDRMYLEKLDYLITVSEGCKAVLEEIYTDYKKKIRIIENINSPSVMYEMAKKENAFQDDYQGLRIITIGRLVEQKGIDLAILACKRLIEAGYDLQWHIIGEGPERAKLESLIEKLGLQKTFYLMGEVRNPYPFIDECDLYVQPSRFEGKSIAVEEVKIFHKPMVVTNHPGFYEQVKNEVTGLIVSMDVEGVYFGIKRLIDNKKLRARFSSELKRELHGNEDEVKHLYELLDGIPI
jgi:glycosyltransferase involved in cell wall biosynthesis